MNLTKDNRWQHAISVAAALAANHGDTRIEKARNLDDMDSGKYYYFSGEAFGATSAGAANGLASANDNRLVQAYYSEPLTTYFTSGWDKDQEYAAEIDMLCPPVLVNRRFEFGQDTNVEAFLLDNTTDDQVGIGADYKTVEYTSTKTQAKTFRRGLMISVDRDEIVEGSNWQQRSLEKLSKRIQRGIVYRSYGLYVASASQANFTWSTGTDDPDTDILEDLTARAAISGLRPNTVMYGETARNYRIALLRNNNNAGRFMTAEWSEEALAKFLKCRRVGTSMSRYSSSATSKPELLGSKCISFFQEPAGPYDPSNIKRFVSNTYNGGLFRVFERNVDWSNRVLLGVEYYENLILTSTLGIGLNNIS